VWAFEGGRQGSIVNERLASIDQPDTPGCKVSREVFSDMLFQGTSRGLVGIGDCKQQIGYRG
jgi:hypothetical protein